MIQELLGGPAPAPAPSALLGLAGDTKISIHGGPHHHLFQTSNSSPNYSTLSPSTSPSPTTSTTPTTPSTTNPTSTQNLNNNNNNNNGLRCPRCDSSNTKFCYYNNYNLTQPRHFCKTCRRYWTKGGALRNVPIGGGCRKNKTSILVTSSKSTNAKMFRTMSPEIGRTAFDVLDHDHDLSSNPILWGSSSSSSSPQSSHLLALLRATSQNPNPSSNHVKEEILIGSGTQPVVQTGALNGRPIGLDGSNHPSLSSLWRSSNNQQQQQQNGGLVGGDVGMQELYQRLIRSSSSSTTNSSYHHHHNSNSQSQPVLLMSNAASSSSSSSVLESAPVIGGGGEMGYGWNVPAFSWSDLPTTNGAYP